MAGLEAPEPWVRRARAWLPLLGLVAAIGLVVWLLVRPGASPPGAEGPRTTAPPSPCRPIGSPGPAQPVAQASAAGWRISVAEATLRTSVPEVDGTGTIDAAAGKIFLVVDAAFRRVDRTKGRAVDTGLITLTCEDGTRLVPDGVGVDRGFCFACSTRLDTEEPVVHQLVVFRLFLEQTGQGFLFRYGGSDPIAVRPHG